MKKLTVGSCFSGIGGLELGLEWTGGFETKWQIEIDPYATKVLKTDQRRYKVFEDASYEAEKEPGKTDNQWRYHELRGPHGYLYAYSEIYLACVVFASTEPHAGNRSQKAVKAIAEHSDWKVIQSGDEETTLLIPNAHFQDAVDIIAARKRIIRSPEAAQRLAQYRFKPLEVNPSAQEEAKP